MDALRNLMTCPTRPYKMAYSRFLIGVLVLCLCGTLPVVSAQENTTLTPFQTVSGSISAGETQTWTLDALEGQVLSLVVQATSGDLDPLLSLSSSTDAPVLSNDDYDPPQDTSAVLEAITLPRRDTYTITVSGFGDTAGDYDLTLNSGYGTLLLDTTLEPQGSWQIENNSVTTVDISDDQNQIALVLEQPQRGLVSLTELTLPEVFYAQVDTLEINSRADWSVGMALLQRANAYYLYQVNERGQWRALVHLNGEDRILRDWVTHPAIVTGETVFRQGVLVREGGFDFFYNDVFIGSVTDTTLNTFGQFGLSVETSGTLDTETIVRYAAIKVSARIAPADAAMLPQQLIVGNTNTMIQELQRRSVIPADGRLGLTIQESSASLNRPGVNEILLGGEQRFNNQVIGTTVSWQIQGDEPAGCGLILQAQNAADYTIVYLDQTGGYGISHRANDTFAPGLFGENPAFAASTTHHLLVIATGAQFHLYIDGLYVGEAPSSNRDGAMGNAAINFEPAVTTCQFRDTWLWSWD